MLLPYEFSRTSRILYSLPRPILPFPSVLATCAVLLGHPSRALSTAILIFLGECPLCNKASTSQCQSSYKMASSFCKSRKMGSDSFPHLVFLCSLLFFDLVDRPYPDDNPCWRSSSNKMCQNHHWCQFGGPNLTTSPI